MRKDPVQGSASQDRMSGAQTVDDMSRSFAFTSKLDALVAWGAKKFFVANAV